MFESRKHDLTEYYTDCLDQPDENGLVEFDDKGRPVSARFTDTGFK